MNRELLSRLPLQPHLVADGLPLTTIAQARKSVRELAYVLCGKIALMGSNAALMLFLANRMQLGTFGLLVTVITAQLLFSRILMLGVGSGLVRLQTVEDLRSRPHEVVQAGLRVIKVTTIGLTIVSFGAGVVLWLLQSPHWPAWLVPVVLTGAVGTALVDYAYSYWLSGLQYGLAASVQGTTAVVRSILTLLAFLAVPNQAVALIATYSVVSLLSGFGHVLVLHRKNPAKPPKGLVARLLRYSRWVGGANIVVMFNLYQGIFLLGVLKQETAAGIFGLGLTLSMGFMAMNIAFGEYLLPRMVRADNVTALKQFLGRALLNAIVLALGGILATVIIGELLRWFLHEGLLAAIPVFYCLAASMLLLLVQSPLQGACQYLFRPQLVLVSWVLRITFVAVFGLLLAPGMGALGAALAQLLGSALAVISLGVLLTLALRSA